MAEKLTVQLAPESVEKVLEEWPDLDTNIYDTKIDGLPVFSRLLGILYQKHGLNASETDLIWRNSNLMRDPDYHLYRQRFEEAHLVFSDLHKSGYDPELHIGSEPVTYYKRVKLLGSARYEEGELSPHTTVTILESGEREWQIDLHSGLLPVLGVGKAIYFGGSLGVKPKEAGQPEP